MAILSDACRAFTPRLCVRLVVFDFLVIRHVSVTIAGTGTHDQMTGAEKCALVPRHEKLRAGCTSSARRCLSEGEGSDNMRYNKT